jgi:hypothetical protein
MDDAQLRAYEDEICGGPELLSTQDLLVNSFEIP